MNNKQTFLTDYLLAELLKLIMKKREVSMQDALDILYNSQLYAKISDPRTGLYFQSADYNYEILEEELNHANPVATNN